MHTVLAVLLVYSAAAAAGGSISGRVLDAQQRPVADATVQLEAAGQKIDAVQTTTDGRFELRTSPGGDLRVVVTATGFAPAVRMVSGNEESVDIVLQVAPVFEQVTVTSTRTDLARTDPTATMTVLSGAELLTSAPLAIDDAMKSLPGFTLFRRNSSRVSNPTSQGIILRGLGGTSQSRSLVLADGVPLNDAFGGWIYWDKIPQAAIDRIEVERGSGSDLYGADALGGVVQVLTLHPNRPVGRGVVEAGTLGTAQVSLFGGGRTSGLMYSAAGEWFKTDGFVPVSEHQNPGIAPRGPVDSLLGSRHRSALITADYQTPNAWRIGVRGSVFGEDRANGTPLSTNGTDSRQGELEIAGGVGGGLISLRAFGGTQSYDQIFTTVNATRTAETINRLQTVPSDAEGFAAQWVRAWPRYTLLVGGEERFINGKSIETPFSQGRAQPTITPGGKQRVGSGFVQSTVSAGDRLTIVAGAHADGWHSESNNSGFSKTTGSFNPRLAAAYRVGSGDVSIRASVYGGFRAPTLNELYRTFTQGNTQTQPNEALEPERLKGVDAGVSFNRNLLSGRLTGYYNVLDGAITSLTLSSTPTLIVRQRANADQLIAKGIEVEGDVKLPARMSIGVAGAILDSVYGGTGSLSGKRVPNVPHYNLGVTARYDDRTWSGFAQLRVTGPAPDDDQNTLILRRATVVDVSATRAVTRYVRAFVAVENLFNEEYDAARSPVLTIGLPRTARAGLQFSLP